VLKYKVELTNLAACDFYSILLGCPLRSCNNRKFLADRTNGRAYATVLCLSVRLSVCL